MALPHFLAGGGEIGALMRAKSWSDTLLGAPETWPEALKMAVSICLNSRFPISLWWGPELVMLYNDAWRPILGKTKHPAALGRPGIESWPEIWDIIGAQFTSVLTRGEATWSDDLLLVVNYTGGEPLDHLVRQLMEIGQFLRLSVALSGAIGQLHGLGLIHKDRRT